MSEEQAQQLLYQLQMLESYFSDLTQKESALFQALRETTAAVESVKAIQEKSESETLVPIGMGVYVKTKVSSSDKIIINVGAGVAMEKDNDSTLNFLESRIKEIEVGLKNTTAQKQDITNRLEQGKHEMDRLIQAGRAHRQQK